MFNVGSVAVQPKLVRLKRATQVSAFHYTSGALLRSGCPGRSARAADGVCGLVDSGALSRAESLVRNHVLKTGRICPPVDWLGFVAVCAAFLGDFVGGDDPLDTFCCFVLAGDTLKSILQANRDFC